MSQKQKYYVVWEGMEPGIYDNWEDCKEQIERYPGAKYKSFKTKEEAVAAYRGNGEEEASLFTMISLKNLETLASQPPHPDQKFQYSHPDQPALQNSQIPATDPINSGYPDYSRIPEINPAAIAVDGACSGNPGMMEYRGVRVANGEEIFHIGPLAEGTNNVAEYLALIHALAYLFKNNDFTTPIYTDSATAVAWVRNRGCHTKLQPTAANKKIFEMLARADVWIRTHHPRNPILRWNTPLWGEIPADFGRK